MKLPVLETDRLFLLPWRLEYAKDMLLFASNENVINSAGGWKLITDENKAKIKIKNWIDKEADEWAISIKKENKIIGWIGMHKNSFKNYDFSLDFGYGVAEEYWGKGIAAEAAQKLMHYAFIGLKCDVMTVSHKVFNKRSRRVIEKCQFNFRGVYPKSKSNDKNSLACYFLTREEYINLYNITNQKTEYYTEEILLKYNRKLSVRSGKSQQQTNKVKGSPYSLNSPIRKINKITYMKEPTGYLCGQTCIAMLANVPVDEVIKIMETDKGTNKQDLKKALDYYGIRYAPKSTKFDANVPLPNLCIIRMILPGYGHWGIYYNGSYYDPEFGKLKNCPTNAKIFQVWEIFQ